MKLKFKVQSYQTSAVESVVDCFAGQVNTSGITYRLDPGRQPTTIEYTGFKNADIQLTDAQLLANIQAVQRRQNLLLSDKLVSSAGCKVNLDIEMETGTGKTYCYIKTVFEMNKRYGWTKFIVVAPSIAIREGVLKSLDITVNDLENHFGNTVQIDDRSRASIMEYLTSNAAEKSSAKRSVKIMKSLGNQTPVRITEIPYIREKHRKIQSDVLKRLSIGSLSNCSACHTTAESGNYDDDYVVIPE